MRLPLLPALLAALLLAAPAHAVDPGEMLDDPALEARAQEIGKELRCLVCQNQSIFDSNSGLARDLRDVVRERLVAGDSDDAVLAYVAERFGDYVLLEPPVKAETAILWLAPVAFLVLALGAGAIYLHRPRRRARPESEPTEAELQRARALLTEDVT